jgi:3',5'-cyclic-AMP phosphodiesterase
MQTNLEEFRRRGRLLSANGFPEPAQTAAGGESTMIWVQIGDLHMTVGGPPFHHPRLIVDQVNALCESISVDFVVVAGDIAQNASREEYFLAQAMLRRLVRPVCPLPGDHDVSKGSLNLYQEYLAPLPYYSFGLGPYQNIFLNANGFPERAPKDFDLDDRQLDWLGSRLEKGRRDNRQHVLFIHPYPTELKTTGPIVIELIRRYHVLYVGMGHRHYNQILNHGGTVYTATRSTVQIQEDQGQPGVSVAVIDKGVVSWKFFPTGQREPFTMIISPADQRMITDPSAANQTVSGETAVRAIVASRPEIESVKCLLAGRKMDMKPVGQGIWETPVFDSSGLANGPHSVRVIATDRGGARGVDEIRMFVYQNAIAAGTEVRTNLLECDVGQWRIKGIPGGLLGPNEDGYEWTKTGLAEVPENRIPAELRRVRGMGY